MSGAANSFPFLYQGLEHEVTDPGQLYFEPSGNVYNPQIQRELSQLGQQGLGDPPSGGGGAGYGGFGNFGGHGGSGQGGPSKLVGALSDLAVVGGAFASAESLNSPDVCFEFGGSEFGIKLPIPLLGNLLCFIDCGNNNDDQPRRPPHETSQTYQILGIRLIRGQRSVVRVSDSEYEPPTPLYYPDDFGITQQEMQFWQTLGDFIAYYVNYSTGDAPRNSNEEKALKQAQKNPEAGITTSTFLRDPHFPASQGWKKMVQYIDGVEIHYVFNPSTGEATDFKIKRK